MGNQQKHHQLEEDLSLNDYRYLIKQTNLTPYVIQGWYREFLIVCPNGQLNKNQFIKFYEKLENSSTKNVESIAENVFQAFDHNGNHRIDFKEFLIAYVLTSTGEPIDQLQYVFSLFDKDQSQTIELNEMIELLKKLFTITGNKIQNSSPESIALDLFRTLDLDRNHSLSKEEFINGCLQNESIRNVLSPFEHDYPSKYQ